MGVTAQTVTPKRAAAQKMATADNSFTLTENGVDVLVIGKPFRSQPPAGSFYDKAVKKWVSDYGNTHYELKKNGETVGEAIVGDGKLQGLNVSAKSVKLANGIKVGDLLFSVLGKEGVTATLGSFDMDSDELDVMVEYGGVAILLSYPVKYSASGVKKKSELEKKIANYDPFEDPNQPVAKMTKEDFDITTNVTGFSVGVPY